MDLWIGSGAVVLVALYVISLYNGLVSGRNEVANSFSQIDVQLQRRYDLIPNLVETVKAYLSHERETLEAVISARSAAQSAAQGVRARPGDAAALKELAGSEAMLGGALTRLFALVESYPELKANESMADFREELASTENRVAFARQAFNDSVTRYNIRREKFPDVIIASIFNFYAAAQWTMSDTGARETIRVNF